MFTARRYDIETGLYYYRARYYNPYVGRFLQKDPAGQGMNWYAYCGNNSLNCSDPTGLYAVYEHSFPAEILGTFRPGWLEASSILPFVKSRLQTEVFLYCANVGFWAYDGGKFAGWNITDVNYFPDPITGEPMIHVMWESEEADEPEFTIGTDYAQVVYDNSKTLLPWQGNVDGRIWGEIPYLVLTDCICEIGLLDDKTIKNIITPALNEVDRFASRYNANYADLTISNSWTANLFMFKDWDSWFNAPFNVGTSPATPLYLYGGTVYSSAEINYIVGGYAFRKLGYSHLQMNLDIWLWKNLYGLANWNYRSISDLAKTYYWAEKGWNLPE